MKVSISQSNQPGSGSGTRDAESIFRSKPVADIRTIESQTRKQIEDKKEELRQLIGNRYRDLIDSADSILLMKSSCESISSNIVSISDSINALSFQNPNYLSNSCDPNPKRVKLYGIGTRVKYLVDTPENIWGCLDECMFFEASARYSRAKLVYKGLKLVGDDEGLILRKNFPLLNHQWQLVSSFKVQISQRSRERLNVVEGDVGRVGIGVFADALAGAAVIDELDPKQALGLFLDSRRSWILNKVGGFDGGVSVVDVLCEVTKVIQVTIAQVGQMFLQVLNDMPLFYKVILGSPPASQLFGGIPNPDEEVRLWNEFREKLESVMVMLDREFIATACSSWLRDCGREIVNKINGRCLIDAIANGAELATAEKLIRESMDSKDVLEGSLEWLKSVFGSDIELPWSRTRELVLGENVNLWDEIFEEAFSSRMKDIIDSSFEGLIRSVNVHEAVRATGGSFEVQGDFKTYLSRSSADGGVWFTDLNAKKSSLVPSLLKTSPEEYDFDSCLGAYFGAEATRIKDAVGSCCYRVLGDLLCFLESPKASLRLKDLAPYLQNKCYESVSSILTDLKNELDNLRAALNKVKQGSGSQTPAAIVERSLFIGRLLFAFQNHSKYIMLVLGSPRLWVNEISLSGSSKVHGNFPALSRHSGFSLDPSRLDSPGKQLVNSPRHGGFSLDPSRLDSPGKQSVNSPRRQMSLATNALFGADDSTSLKLDELVSSMKELCIAAHGLWISWVSDELANILAEDLRQDDGLSAATPLHGWEEVVVKQEQQSDSDSDWKISLPSVPSLYMTSFLFKACQEVHRVGGHVLDKTILQQFARRLLDKIIGIYGDILANGAQISEKGVLQVLLDLRFAADILSGCDSNVNEDLSKSSSTKFASRRKQDKSTIKSTIRGQVDDLINRFSQRLDPIDWQTFEPYLWENEKQSYLRHAVLFGFFVQLNRLYTDTVQKLPTNSESNIMRCSTVPRFKYLPISAPALSPRVATTKTPLRTSSDDIGSRSAWKTHANGELSPEIGYDDSSGFGVATPLLKSFMQVGSRFGEGTLKLGSILNDARFKDKASAMSSFGDILPVQAAGLLSSFTASSKSDS